MQCQGQVKMVDTRLNEIGKSENTFADEEFLKELLKEETIN